MSTTLADVRAFMATWIQPANATVVVAGPFAAAPTRALAERYFGPRRRLDRRRPAAGGANDICALRRTGAVVCWGINNVGQLGAGLPTAYIDRGFDANSVTPVEVVGLQGVRSIAGGGDTFCAVTSCGAVACWGDNQFGEAGDGTLPPNMCASSSDSGCVGKSVPTEVLGITDAISVTIGSRVACALRPAEVDCWGSAQDGQFGDAGTLPAPNGSLGFPVYPTAQVVLTF